MNEPTALPLPAMDEARIVVQETISALIQVAILLESLAVIPQLVS